MKLLEELEICNRIYSITLGKIVFEGLPGKLNDHLFDLVHVEYVKTRLAKRVLSRIQTY